jgi:hypothetical protein
LPALAEAALGIVDLKLLILDLVVSAITGDSHENSETRRGAAAGGRLHAELRPEGSGRSTWPRWRAVERGKKALGVMEIKPGYQKPWLWQLPDRKTATDAKDRHAWNLAVFGRRPLRKP